MKWNEEKGSIPLNRDLFQSAEIENIKQYALKIKNVQQKKKKIKNKWGETPVGVNVCDWTIRNQLNIMGFRHRKVNRKPTQTHKQENGFKLSNLMSQSIKSS